MLNVRSGAGRSTGLRYPNSLKARVASKNKTAEELRDIRELEVEDIYARWCTKVHPHTGAQRIQYAIMVDALYCLGLEDGITYEETITWICSPEEDHIFSFIFCCRALDLNPSATKKVLLSAHQPVGQKMGRRFRAG